MLSNQFMLDKTENNEKKICDDILNFFFSWILHYRCKMFLKSCGFFFLSYVFFSKLLSLL